MTPEKKAKILDKVKKLLALSKSPNEHEAALAAARAHELLLKYNLSVAEIKEAGDVVMLDATKESSAWMRILINSVCKAFYCQPFLRDGSTALVIIGVAADAEVALCTYRYLYDTVIRLAGDFWKSGLAPEGKGVLTSYCLGVVSSISDTLDTIAARNEQASPEGPNAIVLMRKAREGRIDDFLKDEVQVGGEFKGKHKITDRLAYLSGRKDGRAVKIAPDKALA